MFWAIVSVVFLIVGIICGLKNARAPFQILAIQIGGLEG